MSYLQIPGGIANFSKAVISFWFRAEAASINAVHDRFDSDSSKTDGWGWMTPPFTSVLPLLSFGSAELSTEGPTSPSFIGLDCGQYVDRAILVANLQTSATASGQTDAPLRPDAFYIGDGARADTIRVTPDQWHHIIVSFNLRGCSATMDSPPAGIGKGFVIGSWGEFWWAFDDVNYTRLNLRPSGGVQEFGHYVGVPPTLVDDNSHVADNGIVSNGVFNLSHSASGATSLAASPIKASGNPVGVPSSAHYVDNIYHVEMAEFQMWTGVTLDTSDEKNRRAFLDYKRDSDGNRVPGEDGEAIMEPVPPEGKPPTEDKPDGEPAPAEKLLGKRPDILLHGSSDWTNGKNTGSLGVDTDGNEIPSGQFEPTGGIPSYLPDPSLHGPQSPPPPTRRKAGPVRLTKNPVANARL